MDNQHRQIDGYRDFGKSTVDQINTIKAAERDLPALHRQIADVPDVDPRSLAIARTKIQEAFMWMVRAVAKPVDHFE